MGSPLDQPSTNAPIRCKLRVHFKRGIDRNKTRVEKQTVMNTLSHPLRLIFTDLDGSLLDHHSYSFKPAIELLDILETKQIPVIPVTSKTMAEVVPLRQKLANQHPFIIENGAAICIPCNYFSRQPENAKTVGDFWVIENAAGRQNWLDLLAQNSQEFLGEYQTFDSIHRQQGVEGIAELTGLSSSAAKLANNRQFSEPVHWTGTAARKKLFVEKIRDAGATVLQGGRFLSIGDNIDKGLALLQLQDLYLQNSGQKSCQSLAVGDSGNDISMLEQASSALIIKSRNHPAPELKRSHNFRISNKTGPNGWAEGVRDWLERQS